MNNQQKIKALSLLVALLLTAKYLPRLGQDLLVYVLLRQGVPFASLVPYGNLIYLATVLPLGLLFIVVYRRHTGKEDPGLAAMSPKAFLQLISIGFASFALSILVLLVVEPFFSSDSQPFVKSEYLRPKPRGHRRRVAFHPLYRFLPCRSYLRRSDLSRPCPSPGPRPFRQQGLRRPDLRPRLRPLA